MTELNPADIERMKAEFAAKGGKASQIPQGATKWDPSTVPVEYQVFTRGFLGRPTVWSETKRARIRALIAAEAPRAEVVAAVGGHELTEWHETVWQLNKNGITLPKYLEMDMTPAKMSPRAPRIKKMPRKFKVLSHKETEAFDLMRRGFTVTQALRSVGLPWDPHDVSNVKSLVDNRFGSWSGLLAVDSRGDLLDQLDQYSTRIPAKSNRVCLRCKGERASMDGRAEAKRYCEPCEVSINALAQGSFV